MTKKKIIKIVEYIVLLLAVVAIFGAVAHFTNGFTTEFKTFYVSVEGKDVMTKAGGFLAAEEQPLEVDVKYTFGAATDTSQDYSVKIVPNKVQGKNFYFTVNGDQYAFYSEKDLTLGFDIVKGEKSFTITPKGGTITKVLEAIYTDKEIGDCDEFEYEDMFTAVVTSYNGTSAVEVSFSVSGRVTGVTLDREVITF